MITSQDVQVLVSHGSCDHEPCRRKWLLRKDHMVSKINVLYSLLEIEAVARSMLLWYFEAESCVELYTSISKQKSLQ
jgi:hypothetical protein